MIVAKEFTFDAAHQLQGYSGKCAHLHGHTYRLIVAVEGLKNLDDSSSSYDMVMDFSVLKRIIQQEIVEVLDHKFISDGTEPILFALPESSIFRLNKRTTAENIVLWIFHRLYQINQDLDDFSTFAYVELYETPTSKVRISYDDYINGRY